MIPRFPIFWEVLEVAFVFSPVVIGAVVAAFGCAIFLDATTMVELVKGFVVAGVGVTFAVITTMFFGSLVS